MKDKRDPINFVNIIHTHHGIWLLESVRLLTIRSKFKVIKIVNFNDEMTFMKTNREAIEEHLTLFRIKYEDDSAGVKLPSGGMVRVFREKYKLYNK